MNNSLFNSVFEISMRLLLLLSLYKKKGLTLDSLVITDFVTNYSKEFGLSDSNLHGDNEFSFSEFSTRRALTQDAIKQLVLEDMIKIAYSKNGFEYFISERGNALCNTLTSDYAIEYRLYATKALTYIDSKSEKELLALINRRASKSLWKE